MEERQLSACHDLSSVSTTDVKTPGACISRTGVGAAEAEGSLELTGQSY